MSLLCPRLAMQHALRIDSKSGGTILESIVSRTEPLTYEEPVKPFRFTAVKNA